MPKLDIPTIHESLKHDYLAHQITAHEVAHCTCCGKPLTEDEACYTNMQNLFEGRYICWEYEL